MQSRVQKPGERIRSHVVTGFLGSGKTTFLNATLTDAGDRVAVIINEFAALGIDQALVAYRDDNVVLLSNGCACCTAYNDLVEALHRLRRHREDAYPTFRRVLVETTGLADPNPVVNALLGDPRLNRRFLLGAVLTLVDSTHVLDQLDRYTEAQRQIVAGDHLLISKSDLCHPNTLNAVSACLHSLNPTAPQRIVMHGSLTDKGASAPAFALTLDQTIGVPRWSREQLSPSHNVRAHVIEISERVDWSSSLNGFRAYALHAAVICCASRGSCLQRKCRRRSPYTRFTLLSTRPSLLVRRKRRLMASLGSSLLASGSILML